MTRKALFLSVCVCAILSCPPYAGADSPAKPKSPVDALAQKLKKPVIKGTLQQAIQKCEKLADVRIHVDWTALSAAGVKADAKVLAEAPEATVEQLLDMILRQVAAKGKPLAWYIDNKVVRITTQGRVLHRRKLPVRATKGPKTSRPRGPGQLNFENTPLEDVIRFFRKLSGVNFHVNWKALNLVNVSRKTPITLKVKGVRIAKALDLVLDQLSAGRGKYDSVYWVIDEGVVMISTGTALDRRLRTRVYDVGDLLMIVPNFKGPGINFKMNNQTTGGRGQQDTGKGLFEDSDRDDDEGREGENAAEQRKRARENLIKIIKDSIGEEMWQPQGKGSVSLMGNKLIISQTLLGFKLLEQTTRRQ